MIIRKATTSDASAIQRLLVQLGYPDFSENDSASMKNSVQKGLANNCCTRVKKYYLKKSLSKLK